MAGVEVRSRFFKDYFRVLTIEGGVYQHEIFYRDLEAANSIPDTRDDWPVEGPDLIYWHDLADYPLWDFSRVGKTLGISFQDIYCPCDYFISLGEANSDVPKARVTAGDVRGSYARWRAAFRGMSAHGAAYYAF